MKPSKVPALAEIDRVARKMARQWMIDETIGERVGEEEFAFRMFRLAARRGREIGRKEHRDATPRPRASKL